MIRKRATTDEKEILEKFHNEYAKGFKLGNVTKTDFKPFNDLITKLGWEETRARQWLINRRTKESNQMKQMEERQSEINSPKRQPVRKYSSKEGFGAPAPPRRYLSHRRQPGPTSPSISTSKSEPHNNLSVEEPEIEGTLQLILKENFTMNQRMKQLEFKMESIVQGLTALQNELAKRSHPTPNNTSQHETPQQSIKKELILFGKVIT